MIIYIPIYAPTLSQTLWSVYWVACFLLGQHIGAWLWWG